MTPTDSLRAKLRRLLDEKIPAGGVDSDTRFLDSEIDDLLQEADSIYEAAANGWTEKAGMYQREMAGLEETMTGQERYKLTSLKDQLEYALNMAKTYRELAQKEKGGSFMLGVEKPEVL